MTNQRVLIEEACSMHDSWFKWKDCYLYECKQESALKNNIPKLRKTTFRKFWLIALRKFFRNQSPERYHDFGLIPGAIRQYNYWSSQYYCACQTIGVPSALVLHNRSLPEPQYGAFMNKINQSMNPKSEKIVVNFLINTSPQVGEKSQSTFGSVGIVWESSLTVGKRIQYFNIKTAWVCL